VYTALYGYGGNVDVPQSGGAQDKTEELTFADVVWSATSDHPAKPSGQTYLEWPEKTALYGRNGRPRYGYYQNASIKDANTLLEKTWESLKQSCEPKISISGSCVDLSRMGYNDVPLRLHDLAIVEIEETGEVFQKQIICCDVDLIDPTGSRVEIGDYIPNIVYINRDTNDKAKGGGGGGGGGKGSMTALEDSDVKTWTDFLKTQNKIGMVVGTFNGTNKVLGGQIVLAINDDGGSTALIQADTIDIQGLINDLAAYAISVTELTANKVMAQGAGTSIECEEDLDCGGSIGCGGDIGCNGTVDTAGLKIGNSSFLFNGHTVTMATDSDTGLKYLKWT
jgi:hypothetical protein